ncbi:molybdate ABC transporter substrate-binding protein [Altererythrobacter sp. B11]|uniref:molybdate ABC transporter substrate-binding protein n=1 Tax=Altererythrobacter sp. B11 TaxID=2060312 RepID=UPI000DC704DA|nr:molybdate ABC transporter substrate-binding protein [Altererythrobacter sp. B11]BBC74387.1 molybdate ABC transporter substrate-binding protein [Altererythrobacter sp. B11]
MIRRVPLSLRWLLAALLLPLLTACGGAEGTESGAPVVLAAASMQEALTDAAGAWTAAGHPAPQLSFAASSALARQIEGGAPADIYLPADEEWMDRLEGLGLLRQGSRADLLSNSLVLIAPASSPPRSWDGTRAGLLALLDDGRIALAEPDVVPAGRYAQAALQSIGAWDALSRRVAVAENVRAALALVERGEVPLGVVYATDATASAKVRVLASFPASSHPPIRYPVALLAASSNAQAPDLLAFLRSDQARAIFAAHGFGGPQG